MTGKIGNSVVPIYWGEKKWFQTKIERERERFLPPGDFPFKSRAISRAIPQKNTLKLLFFASSLKHRRLQVSNPLGQLARRLKRTPGALGCGRPGGKMGYGLP